MRLVVSHVVSMAFQLDDCVARMPLVRSPPVIGVNAVVLLLCLQQLREFVRSVDGKPGTPPVFSADDSFVMTDADVSHSPIPSEAPIILQYFCKSLLQLRTNLLALQESTLNSDSHRLQLFDPAFRSLWNGTCVMP